MIRIEVHAQTSLLNGSSTCRTPAAHGFGMVDVMATSTDLILKMSARLHVLNLKEWVRGFLACCHIYTV